VLKGVSEKEVVAFSLAIGICKVDAIAARLAGFPDYFQAGKRRGRSEHGA